MVTNERRSLYFVMLKESVVVRKEWYRDAAELENAKIALRKCFGKPVQVVRARAGELLLFVWCAFVQLNVFSL